MWRNRVEAVSFLLKGLLKTDLKAHRNNSIILLEFVHSCKTLEFLQ